MNLEQARGRDNALRSRAWSAILRIFTSHRSMRWSRQRQLQRACRGHHNTSTARSTSPCLEHAVTSTSSACRTRAVMMLIHQIPDHHVRHGIMCHIYWPSFNYSFIANIPTPEFELQQSTSILRSSDSVKSCRDGTILLHSRNLLLAWFFTRLPPFDTSGSV